MIKTFFKRRLFLLTMLVGLTAFLPMNAVGEERSSANTEIVFDVVSEEEIIPEPPVIIEPPVKENFTTPPEDPTGSFRNTGPRTSGHTTSKNISQWFSEDNMGKITVIVVILAFLALLIAFILIMRYKRSLKTKVSNDLHE